MSKILRSSDFTRFLLLTAVGLVPLGLPLFAASPCLAQDYGGQDPGMPDMPLIDPFGQFPGENDLMPRRGLRTKAARKKSQSSAKGTTNKADTTGKTKNSATKKEPGGTTELKFSQDIAPIIVANCTGCHSKDGEGVRRGKLDLSTIEKLQKGTPDHKIVVPGKPAESHLILRLRGKETPRMPRRGILSDDAIAKIEQWVKDGAKIDAGVDHKKTMESYAASPEQVRKNQLAKLPPQERDKAITATGLGRWRQANPKLKPEITRSEHFVMFGTGPSDRAASTLKVMEAQYGHLKRLLGSPSMDWVEKVSLYVFPSRKDFIEFVRTVESREAETDVLSTARFAVPQPYLAIVDPAGGKKDEPGASKRKGRSRRGEDGDAENSGSDRNLAGVLAEALGSATVAGSGNPPRWLALGIGSYLSAQLEPRSHYYRQLRQTAFANFDQGWKTKANEALGGAEQITADGLHAIGFALVEAMMSGMREGFPIFVRGMLQGGEKLDEVLEKVYGGNRDEFLDGTGDWVAEHYGRLQ